jgi:hypothetical protein
VWFVARHPYGDLKTWEDLRDRVHEALKNALGEDRLENSDPDELWWNDDELRAEVRPCLADVGDTAQFLAIKGLTLSNEARARFSIGSMRTLRLRCAGWRASLRATTALTTTPNGFQNSRARTAERRRSNSSTPGRPNGSPQRAQ